MNKNYHIKKILIVHNVIVDQQLKIKKIRHHNHTNGQFISSLCNECHIKLQYKPFLPIYLHSLKGYDSHLFITALFKCGYQQPKKNKKDFVNLTTNKNIYLSARI